MVDFLQSSAEAHSNRGRSVVMASSIFHRVALGDSYVKSYLRILSRLEAQLFNAASAVQP